MERLTKNYHSSTNNTISMGLYTTLRQHTSPYILGFALLVNHPPSRILPSIFKIPVNSDVNIKQIISSKSWFKAF